MSSTLCYRAPNADGWCQDIYMLVLLSPQGKILHLAATKTSISPLNCHGTTRSLVESTAANKQWSKIAMREIGSKDCKLNNVGVPFYGSWIYQHILWFSIQELLYTPRSKHGHGSDRVQTGGTSLHINPNRCTSRSGHFGSKMGLWKSWEPRRWILQLGSHYASHSAVTMSQFSVWSFFHTLFMTSGKPSGPEFWCRQIVRLFFALF